MLERRARRIALWIGFSISMVALVAACSSETDRAEPGAGATAANDSQSADPKAAACADLVAVQREGVTITGAVHVDGDGPHCKVAGAIDGKVRFELLLPDAWNGKLLMGGGGGFVGSVQNSAQAGLGAGATPLARGYATVGTDTGHTASGIDGSWALGDPTAKENFAHRAVHRTAEVSKQIVAAYHGRGIERSYFFGCSRGGGQALISAQRYPEDFDGIIAGAPAFHWAGMAAEFIRNQQAVFPDPKNVASPVITNDNRVLLAEGVRKACDAQDGVADGMLADPRRCEFDPASLPRCADGPAADCLTQEQLAAIQTLYAPTVADGERVYPGFPFGGETDSGGWDGWMTRTESPPAPDTPNLHFAFGTQLAKYFVFDDPNWSYAGYDFADWRERSAATAKLLDGADPDLARFRSRGGKLILWHGWSDSALSALDTIDYYESVEKLDPDLRAYFRMYLMPGVGHCRGGAGADRVDWITALEEWVEKGTAPTAIVSTKTDEQGTPMLERLLCPYPQVAHYDGSGDVNAARSYRCSTPDR